MNTSAAATQANVTVATIRAWCRNGVITATKQAGRWVIDAASLAWRITLTALKPRKEQAVTTPALPWDEDHPESADLNTLVAHGYTPERIVAALGSDAQGMGRYRAFNGKSRRWMDAQLDAIAQRAEAQAAQARRNADLATPRQINYILDLLAQRSRTGEEGGFMTGPTDRAGIDKMTRSVASAYIDSLKGAY